MFHNLTVVTGIQGENHTSSNMSWVILRDSPIKIALFGLVIFHDPWVVWVGNYFNYEIQHEDSCKLRGRSGDVIDPPQKVVF